MKPRVNTCEDIDIEPKTGAPFFHIILTKTHVCPRYLLTIPAEGARILPDIEVPMILTRGTKSWRMNYIGKNVVHKRFDNRWKQFVVDNKLKVGDICTFELMSKDPMRDMNEEQQLDPVSIDTEEDEEIEPLSGNPMFHTIPAAIAHILPHKTAPVTLTRGKKSWETTYFGRHPTHKRFELSSWKEFVVDNKLRVGDVCIFERMTLGDEALKLKVQVLRGDFPSILLGNDGTSDNPIVVE
uniref:TF-B3 domain-containing protein n=1 Tax=Chenopodium quinoa TaxID=63459 RepID=A0A803ML07_CHEQI